MTRTIKIRGHHIKGILEYFRLRDGKSRKDPFSRLRTEGYGDNYIENKRNICEQIYLNPEQKIKVVNTLDYLCLACFEKRTKKCNNLLFTDAWLAGKQGFMCGKTYLSRDFLVYSRQ